ncbi:hypothetical protein scyTo_0010802 [Scyliorhinus torazame]|uniref:Butyrophilin subfamily 1 member A1-like n=1 Tax=Scyliorhinus torazame TaxID=75743 RepID=A0A401PBP6_SCYTO|nr:hypothetical protein [Scyliorhinus torazame]
MEVRWFRSEWSKMVHRNRQGKDIPESQMEEYAGRTELFKGLFHKGNVSLLLKKVTVKDEGEYTCFVISKAQDAEGTVNLNVANVGLEPVVKISGYQGSRIKLTCESDDWYPKPSIKWLKENREVNTGILEKQTSNSRGLLKVESSLEVTNDLHNRYTCTITNILLNKWLESNLQISGEFFPHVTGWLVAFWILFILLLAGIGGVFYFYWKRRKQRTIVKGLYLRPTIPQYEELAAKLKLNSTVNSGDLTVEIGDLTGNGDLTVEIRDLTGNGDLTVEIGDLTVGSGDSTVGNEDLTVGNGDLTVDIGDLSVDNGDLSVGNGDLTVEIGDLSVGNGDLTVEIGDLSVDNGDLSVDNGDLSVGNGDLTVEIGDLSVDNGDLTVEIGDLTVGNGDSTVGNEDLTVGNGDLTVDIGDLTIVGGVLCEIWYSTGQELNHEKERLLNEIESEKLLHLIEWDKMLRCAVSVSLDPDTANGNLDVSQDQTMVKDGGGWRNVTENPTRFERYPFALATEGFKTGKHYWEVEVGESCNWDLGVAKETVQRKGRITLNEEHGYFVIGRYWEKYEVKNAAKTEILVSEKPRKIGICLNYDEGIVSFHNADTKDQLYVFHTAFTETIFPFFCPWRSQETLKITPVTLEN